MRLKDLARDPLIHFLAAGLVLFVIGAALRPPEADARRIVIDRAALLEFIQYRSKAFEPATAGEILDGMSRKERDALIRDFIEEQALYREATALGLEADDYVIKQRLVQKLNFLTDGAISAAPPTDDEIAAHFDAHRDDYYIQPSATFAHVYFSAETRGADAAASEAVQIAASLNASKAPFEAAVAHGDRFPFHVNYVERTYDYVASQFGEAAAQKIFDARGSVADWRAPLVSPYGAHAVYVKSVTPGRYPDLAEVRDRVADDALRERQRQARERIVQELIAQYDVVVDLDAPAQSAPAGSATP
ncbi:MAG: peptidylprolyl isomerase [Parvularculaceae bacterium]